MKKQFIVAVVTTLMAACSYTPAPENVAAGSDVGGTGKINYTHEDIGPNKHFLTVTAAPGLAETEGSIYQRIHQFSVKYAARTCPEDFRFADDPNMSQGSAGGFMKRTRSYVFYCE